MNGVKYNYSLEEFNTPSIKMNITPYNINKNVKLKLHNRPTLYTTFFISITNKTN